MLADHALCEAPLCAHDFIKIINASSTITLTSVTLAGKIIPASATHDLIIDDIGVMAQGYDIVDTITVTDNLEIIRRINLSASHILTISSVISPNLVYNLAIIHPVFISDGLLVNNIYNVEICQGVFITHHLGWVIDLHASNTITCTVKEVQSAFNNIVMSHAVETNMDDVSCLQPNGKDNDYGPNTNVNVAQSIDGRMIYACSVTSNMSLLSSVAWR